MRKIKQLRQFFFKNKSHQEVVDLLNKEIPISLKENEELIDRIAARYPVLSKSEIALVVTAVFQSFRDLLVLGNSLSFYSIFFDSQFLVTKGGHLKVKLTTSPALRKHNV